MEGKRRSEVQPPWRRCWEGEQREWQTIHVVGPGGRVQPERGAFQVGNSPHRRFITRNLHPVHRPPNDGDYTRSRSPARRCNGGRGRPSARSSRPQRERKCSGCGDTGATARVERLMIVRPALHRRCDERTSECAKIERFSWLAKYLVEEYTSLRNVYIYIYICIYIYIYIKSRM